jgi:primase-polymerase (primpol)-like protein
MILPTELLHLKQWACHNPAKLPINPKTHQAARANDPQTWVTYREACRGLGRYAGLSFALAPDDPYCAIDLDHCFVTQQGLRGTNGFAQEIINMLYSYTEVSPSGEGIHILVHAKLPPGWRKQTRIEMYDERRWIALTGNHLLTTPTKIAARQDEIEHLHELLTTKRPEVRAAVFVRQPDPDDQNLLERMRQHGIFAAVWDGTSTRWTKPGGGRDRSMEEWYLVNRLAFWTRGDARRMDRLMRQWPGRRPKWDRRLGDSTYGQYQISNALAHFAP